MSRAKVSIVFSVFNEVGLDILEQSLESLSKVEFVEVIVVDGGSTDGTIELIESYPVKLFKTVISSRAERLNLGISHSSNDLVLLHHPRSFIDINGIDYLTVNHEGLSWGGFTHQFFEDHPILQFTSWYSNEVRGKIREIIYLDHCIFFKKSLVPDVPIVPHVVIFEDTLLSVKLSKYYPCSILPFFSKTSAIRFKKNGIIKQVILNMTMKLCFYLKISDNVMNKIYEKGLGLNTKY